jgi:multidrug efflux system membrane fusion protein
LRAPINSIVLQKTLEAGTLVSPGKAVFVLADMTSVKAVFGVADQTVGKLKLGSPLSVTTEALPGQEFPGQITRISPAADPKSRVFEVEVTIPNQRQILRSGLIASLFLAESEPSKPVPVVPLSSVVRFNAGKGRGQTPDSYAVFVVEQQGGRQIARSRQVKLGEAFGNTIAVIEGAGVGERVIAIGASLAKDGQPVHVIP